MELIGYHIYINGPGLDEDLKTVRMKDGMMGRGMAREVVSLVVQMIKEEVELYDRDSCWTAPV